MDYNRGRILYTDKQYQLTLGSVAPRYVETCLWMGQCRDGMYTLFVIVSCCAHVVPCSWKWTYEFWDHVRYLTTRSVAPEALCAVQFVVTEEWPGRRISVR